jgi:6-phosphogluconolactonase (cycloisomerase 2 family)
VPRFVHVAASSSNEVPAYTINQATGALSELPNPALTQSRPVTVASDPRHRFLYVANQTAQSIEAFTINTATGALASVGLASGVTGTPTHMTVDPSGRFLYVTAKDAVSASDGWVTTWGINQNDGSIDGLDTHQVTNLALWVQCDPTGTFLYVASKSTVQGGAKITLLRINPVDGSLTPSINAPASAAGVTALGYHPKKRALYSVLTSANAIVTFTADPATGELTVVPGGAGNSGLSPSSISVAPDGRFAYVSYSDPAGTGHLSGFAVDAATGKLLVPAVQYQDGLHPNDLAVDASGRFLYVANSGSNTISVYQVNAATGALNVMTAAASGLEPNALVVTSVTQ